MSTKIVAVEYTCNICEAKQTIRYFTNDSILPVTCCVKCRAGFEVRSESPSQAVSYMISKGIGMFPGQPVAEADAYAPTMSEITGLGRAAGAS